MVSASNSSYTVKSSKHSGIAEMCKSVKWPSSIGLKPFKREESLLEAKNQRSSLLCWCKSPLPWEQSLISGRAAPERDVRRPLPSGAVTPCPGCARLPPRDEDQTPPAASHPQHSDPSEGQGTNTRGHSCQRELQELSLALRQVENGREQSPTKLHCRRALLFDSVHATEMQPAPGWQRYSPESLFSYITMTQCSFNWNLPSICVCRQPEGGIQQCSWRQVGIPEHLKLRRHYSVFQLNELCPDAPCSQQARHKGFALNTLSQVPASAEQKKNLKEKN